MKGSLIRQWVWVPGAQRESTGVFRFAVGLKCQNALLFITLERQWQNDYKQKQNKLFTLCSLFCYWLYLISLSCEGVYLHSDREGDSSARTACPA